MARNCTEARRAFFAAEARATGLCEKGGIVGITQRQADRTEPEAMKPLPLRRHHPAPPFSVTSLAGEPLALEDYTFRRDLLLVALHGPGCPFCAQIVEELSAHRDDWEGWDTALLLLLSDPGAGFAFPFLQASDPKGAVRLRYSGAEADVALAVIEHRGRFMDGWSLQHPAPVDWHEVAETVRWVAVQEPECGACEVLPGYDEPTPGDEEPN